MSISKEEFRAALGRFPSGVTVVTTRDKEGHLHGLTVSAFCSVSLQPSMILVCIDKYAGSHHAFENGGAFVVNILREDQQYVSNQFASKVPDKFEGVDYQLGIEDLPVLKDALVNLECRQAHVYDAGDHTIYVGEVEKVTVREGHPLVYFHGNYREINKDAA